MVSVVPADLARLIFSDCPVALQNEARAWSQFLSENQFDFSTVRKIEFSEDTVLIFDQDGRKFHIDFMRDVQNYQRKKSGIKKELISRALGAGRAGMKVLDLSAGLGMDAVFLSQLGYHVTALERHPLVYLCLQRALQKKPNDKLRFVFSDAVQFLRLQPQGLFKIIYFDPMFPDKKKSALPRQEMVFFREMVGDDGDAAQVLESALSYVGVERVVVKRPRKAPYLGIKPHSMIEGKLVRFDIYTVKNFNADGVKNDKGG